MGVRDPDKASAELDKLATTEPEEDHIEYIKTLVVEGNKAHVEVHLTALEADYPTLDTGAVRAAL